LNIVKKSDVRRRILSKLETEILNNEGDLESIVDKVEHLYKFMKDEGIYTLSCDTGGPAYTIFQLFLCKRASCGKLGDEDELRIRRWARLAVDGVQNCKGYFEEVGCDKQEIFKYYYSDQ